MQIQLALMAVFWSIYVKVWADEVISKGQFSVVVPIGLPSA